LSRLKQLLTISFTFIYFVASSGILLGQHFCMGRVNQSALFKKVEVKCGMSEAMHADMDDCCDDEWSLEIIEDEQQVSNLLQAPKGNFFVLFDIILPEVWIGLNEATEKSILHDNGPPDLASPPLYLFYSHLKIPADLQS